MTRHGTISGYFSDGCRCDECRPAAAKYRKEYRAGRRIRDEKPPSPIRHGTSSGYCDRKCRCDECRAFMAAAARDLRKRRGATPRPTYPTGCSVDGCTGKHMAKGLCRLHYWRVKAGNEPGPLHSVRSAPGDGCITPNGYRIIRGVFEHRAVMEAHIGRNLLKSETVHHKNGDRADNRLSNLELWSKSQPAGQRVVDKLAWAEEILATYADLRQLSLL